MILVRLLLIPIRVLGQLVKKISLAVFSFFKKLTFKSVITFLGSAFLTAWGFYTYYHPKVTLNFTEPLIPSNIVTSYFTLTNSGESNIYNVTPTYNIKSFNVITRDGRNFFFEHILTTNRPEYYRVIASNKKKTLDVNVLNQIGINVGKPKDYIAINVKLDIYLQYDYWYGLKVARDTFRFKSSKLINERIIWTNE